MARPSKYPWEEIEADYKAGVDKKEICRKWKIPKKTLDNKIIEKSWEVSGLAVEAMRSLEQVSGNFGILEATDPKTAAALYDRVAHETDFDIRAGRLVVKTMKRLESLVDAGKKLEKVSVGTGIQELVEVGMMGSDYKDVMDAAYRGKELLKGKDQTGPQVAIQNNMTQNNSIVELSEEEIEKELKARGLPIDII